MDVRWLATILGTHPLVSGLGAAVHLAAAAAACGAWAACRRKPGGRPGLWVWVAACQALLAVDAALGMRMSASDLLRGVFRAHGWYGERREPQVIVSAAVGMVLLATAVVMLRRLRQPARLAAVLGTALCLALLLLGVISLHPVEAAMGWPAGPVSSGMALRGLGAGVALAGAWRAWWAGSAGDRGSGLSGVQ